LISSINTAKENANDRSGSRTFSPRTRAKNDAGKGIIQRFEYKSIAKSHLKLNNCLNEIPKIKEKKKFLYNLHIDKRQIFSYNIINLYF